MTRKLVVLTVGALLLFSSCGGDGTEDVVSEQTGARQTPGAAGAASPAPTPSGPDAPVEQPAAGTSGDQQGPAPTAQSGRAPAATTPEPTDDYDYQTPQPGGPDVPNVPGGPGY